MSAIIADHVLHGRPIDAHPYWAFIGSPIHKEDLIASIAAFLAAAEIGGLTVNWAGDEAITVLDLAEYIAGVGRRPVFRIGRTTLAYPRETNKTTRFRIYGPEPSRLAQQSAPHAPGPIPDQVRHLSQ